MVKIKSQSPIFIRFFCCVVQGLYQHPDLPKLMRRTDYRLTLVMTLSTCFAGESPDEDACLQNTPETNFIIGRQTKVIN
jgi:hypothetical protein